MAMVSMPDRPFLLPNCSSLSWPLVSAISDNPSATTVSTVFPMHLSRDLQRYRLSFKWLSLVALRITTPLALIYTASCLSMRMASFVIPTLFFLPQFQSGHMAATEIMSWPRAFFTDWEYQPHSTACSVMEECTLASGSRWWNWLSSFRGKALHVSMSAFSVAVFRCTPSLSVMPSTAMPTQGLRYCSAHHNSVRLRFRK